MLKKRFAAIILVLGLVFGGTATALAYDYSEYYEPDELPSAIEVSRPMLSPLPARSAILISQNTGQVLFEQNPDVQLPPASITKVMTMLLVVEAIERGDITLNDIVVASVFASSMGGSQIWLEPGEEMTVHELFKAVAVSSANDAAVALAEHVAGSEDAFVARMNERAAQLGLMGTYFVNSCGLDDEGHLTTARDVAIVSRELMRYPLVSEYTTIWIDSLRGGETELVNTNRLVRFYQGATGLKTGTTGGAGSCLAATANRDGFGLVAVVMGSATSDERFAAARGLLDYGFANYAVVQVPSIDDQLAPVKVLRGMSESVGITYDPPADLLVQRGQEDAISQRVTLVSDVMAPVSMGQTLGRVEITVDGEVVSEYIIRAAEDVERMNLPGAFSMMLRGAARIR